VKRRIKVVGDLIQDRVQAFLESGGHGHGVEPFFYIVYISRFARGNDIICCRRSFL
jgi:hypothetical protein